MNLFVYSPVINGWVGEYGYRFDRYLCKGQDIHGMRDVTTHKLDTGTLISGTPVEGQVLVPFNASPGMDRQLCKFRVSSKKVKPTRLTFYDADLVKTHHQDEAKNGPLYVKDYGSWEQHVDRVDATYNANRNLLQDTMTFIRVEHAAEGPFVVDWVAGQNKLIK